MNEYVLVEFDEIREVIIDGNDSGYLTGEVIETDAGTHTISLKEPKDFSPSEQDVNPSGTTAIRPLIIHFSKDTYV
ncbi:MAG: hypothetical protein SV775_17240 [Thermodesulfobacteriota bacterium]|nr:hypothetical protein [Thermodesulfobacteriota bacterium]